MFSHIPGIKRAALITCCLAFVPGTACACDGPQEVRVATPSSIRSFIDDRKMDVLTFTGFSGARYENPGAMIAHASQLLDGRAPEKTLVNIGATAEGIGAVYEIAKQKGFTTMGIVSTLARDEHVALSQCVDYVFFVEDETWGGRIEGTGHLSPTSTAMVESGTSFVAIGGGDVTRDEMLAARQAGKPVIFIAADMNHQIAREKARKKGRPAPVDFKGAAHRALAEVP